MWSVYICRAVQLPTNVTVLRVLSTRLDFFNHCYNTTILSPRNSAFNVVWLLELGHYINNSMALLPKKPMSAKARQI
jgi:hypothetical protein